MESFDNRFTSHVDFKLQCILIVIFGTKCIVHVSIGTMKRAFYVTAPLIFWQRQDSSRS